MHKQDNLIYFVISCINRNLVCKLAIFIDLIWMQTGSYTAWLCRHCIFCFLFQPLSRLFQIVNYVFLVDLLSLFGLWLSVVCMRLVWLAVPSTAPLPLQQLYLGICVVVVVFVYRNGLSLPSPLSSSPSPPQN